MVELQQLENLGGGVKCHILNIGSKNVNGWIVQGSKM
jgi:hypothetical protein